MSIENNIFKHFKPDFNLVKDYGFEFIDNKYEIEKIFFNDLFKAQISINADGKVFGKVIEVENNEEFLPLRIENHQGSYVGEVRNAYEAILQDICDKCFIKNNFVFSQSNRITNLIEKNFGSKPEFLWKQFPGCGVFRNYSTNKWYAAILDVEGSKISKDKKGIIEVIDLKLSKEHVKNILMKPNFYPGYHMNKNFWISIILDDSVSDSKIMELVEESYNFSTKL